MTPSSCIDMLAERVAVIANAKNRVTQEPERLVVVVVVCVREERRGGGRCVVCVCVRACVRVGRGGGLVGVVWVVGGWVGGCGWVGEGGGRWQGCHL